MAALGGVDVRSKLYTLILLACRGIVALVGWIRARREADRVGDLRERAADDGAGLLLDICNPAKPDASAGNANPAATAQPETARPGRDPGSVDG